MTAAETLEKLVALFEHRLGKLEAANICHTAMLMERAAIAAQLQELVEGNRDELATRGLNVALEAIEARGAGHE